VRPHPPAELEAQEGAGEGAGSDKEEYSGNDKEEGSGSDREQGSGIDREEGSGSDKEGEDLGFKVEALEGRPGSQVEGSKGQDRKVGMPGGDQTGQRKSEHGTGEGTGTGDGNGKQSKPGVKTRSQLSVRS